MLKHLYIEKTIEIIDKMVEEMEDRDDRADFANIVQQLVEIHEDLSQIEEEDG